MSFEGIPDILPIYFPDLEEDQHAKILHRERTYIESSIPCTSGKIFSVRAETHISDTIIFCKQISENTKPQIN